MRAKTTIPPTDMLLHSIGLVGPRDEVCPCDGAVTMRVSKAFPVNIPIGLIDMYRWVTTMISEDYESFTAPRTSASVGPSRATRRVARPALPESLSTCAPSTFVVLSPSMPPDQAPWALRSRPSCRREFGTQRFRRPPYIEARSKSSGTNEHTHLSAADEQLISTVRESSSAAPARRKPL